jgi:hypothetical protein
MMAIISQSAYRRTNESGKVDRRGRVKKPIHARKLETKGLFLRAVRVSLDMTGPLDRRFLRAIYSLPRFALVTP